MTKPGKPHMEFFKLNLDEGFSTPPGYPDGFETRDLVCNIDEEKMTGSRSRLMRIKPGKYTTAPFVHNHWEEVYLLDGDLTVGCDANGEGGENFVAPTYACRPAGRPSPSTACSAPSSTGSPARVPVPWASM